MSLYPAECYASDREGEPMEPCDCCEECPECTCHIDWDEVFSDSEPMTPEEIAACNAPF